jgi:hypothetical protein
MPIKHLRSAHEIEETARDLARQWRQGDGVEPFLRRVEPELSRRVRNDNWSWETVARALNRAGITYQTGREWTGELLSQKIRVIRYKRRLRAGRAAVDDARASSPVISTTADATSATISQTLHRIDNAPLGETPEEPEFKPAYLIGGWKPKAIAESPVPVMRNREAKPAPEVDVDAVIARLIGKT